MTTRSAIRREGGFTLVELLVTMMLFGILVTLGVMPLRGYQRTQEHVGAAREVVAALRNAQVRAVSEGTTYKVSFSGNAIAVARRDTATTFVDVKSYKLPEAITVEVVGAGFTPSARTGSTTAVPDAYFYARGDASPGEVRVLRASSGTKAYTIKLEGLTARVSLS